VEFDPSDTPPEAALPTSQISAEDDPREYESRKRFTLLKKKDEYKRINYDF
jgi:hypothetical protein